MVQKISMRATLVQMAPGESILIPLTLRTSNSVRNCASVLALDMGRKYTVSVDRIEGNCKVTRVA